MAGAPPRHRDSPPALPDELVEEIVLRLPPDEPASLLRASLISKAWGRTISSPAFRRRLYEIHRTPPMFGFLHNSVWPRTPRFIPTTASSLSLAAPDRESWRALDCRHGRALLLSQGQDAQELLVWEPITGAQRRVPVPSLFESLRATVKKNNLENPQEFLVDEMYPGVAVFCAADGCDHRDCHGDSFGLVFVFTNYVPADDEEEYEDDEDEEFDIWACVFSSETGVWGRLTQMQSRFTMKLVDPSSVLVGRTLLYFMSDGEQILQYDLATHSMTLLNPPGYWSHHKGRFKIMLTEDGGLGVAEYSNSNLKLWTREASVGTDAQWALSRIINLVNLLPDGALLGADRRVQVVGFAEATNTIFLNTFRDTFSIELQSEKAKKVCDRHGLGLVPIVSFYTPVPRGEHQDPPLSGPSEESGGEEGEEKEKSIEQPQRLFDKGSNDIKEADFVNTHFSHALKTRVPTHEEVALECASVEYGCALLDKAQAMNGPLDDIPKSASNEESVMGTTYKDDALNSKISDRSVEDAAPSFQKVLRR